MYLAETTEYLFIAACLLGVVAFAAGYTLLLAHLERRRRARLTELLQQEGFEVHYQPPSRFGWQSTATTSEQDRLYKRLKFVANRLRELAFQKMLVKPKYGFIGSDSVRFSARRERDGVRIEYVEFEIVMEPHWRRNRRGMTVWHFYSIVLITSEDRSTHPSPPRFEQPLSPAIEDWSKRNDLFVKEFFVAGIHYVVCREWMDPKETLDFLHAATNQSQVS